jgi:hypothetical protein
MAGWVFFSFQIRAYSVCTNTAEQLINRRGGRNNKKRVVRVLLNALSWHACLRAFRAPRQVVTSLSYALNFLYILNFLLVCLICGFSPARSRRLFGPIGRRRARGHAKFSKGRIVQPIWVAASFKFLRHFSERFENSCCLFSCP